MKQGLTEVVFILDMSGSMESLTQDTIGGFNSLIKKQKEEPGEAVISTVLFNETSTVLYDRVPLDKIEPMTNKQYVADGGTALLDAIGGAIHHIGNVQKYARDEDRPEKTLFVITTDGMENSSRTYSLKKVKEMVERQKSRFNWEFIFIGSNIDAINVAGQFGIDSSRAVNCMNDGIGANIEFITVSETICGFRRNKKIDDSWKDKIEKDMQKRGH